MVVHHASRVTNRHFHRIAPVDCVGPGTLCGVGFRAPVHHWDCTRPALPLLGRVGSDVAERGRARVLGRRLLSWLCVWDRCGVGSRSTPDGSCRSTHGLESVLLRRSRPRLALGRLLVLVHLELPAAATTNIRRGQAEVI